MEDDEKLYEELTSVCEQFQGDYESLISAMDVQRLLQAMGHETGDAEYMRIMGKLNMTDDDSMQLSEFIKVVLDDILEMENVNTLLHDFKAIDSERKGYITADELYSIMQENETDVSQEEIEWLMCTLDVTGSGQLYYDHFLENLFNQ